MWHSFHIAGEYAAIAMTAALNFRDLSGSGKLIDVSVHEAVNTCTEIAIPTTSTLADRDAADRTTRDARRHTDAFLQHGG
jgi:crotonobetainyl-CoA:carnitine CoA-transferase CaiB-like acyl-CoA transferase